MREYVARYLNEATGELSAVY